MERVRYALIGFGGIAENRIGKEGFCLDRARFAPHPNADLVGVFDLNPRRREAAEAMGLRWYGALEEILSDEGIQAVVVTTDNLSHCQISEKALRAGKHCLVEKPISTTLEDALSLQRLSRAKGLSLGVDHMMRENAFNKKAVEMVFDGSLGPVNDITVHMEFLYGASPEEEKTWRCSDRRQLGGPLGDVGSHCLYMAEFLLKSRISRVACIYVPKTLKIEVEDGAFIQYFFENGVRGTARVAFNAPRGGPGGMLTNLGYEIYGAEATLRGYATMFQLSGHPGEPAAIRLELDRAGAVRAVQPGPVFNIYQQSVARHAESILQGNPMDGAEGVHNLALILACHESAQKGGAAVSVSQ